MLDLHCSKQTLAHAAPHSPAGLAPVRRRAAPAAADDDAPAALCDAACASGLEGKQRVTLPSGLQYVDIVPGKGASPPKGYQVTGARALAGLLCFRPAPRPHRCTPRPHPCRAFHRTFPCTCMLHPCPLKHASSLPPVDHAAMAPEGRTLALVPASSPSSPPLHPTFTTASGLRGHDARGPRVRQLPGEGWVAGLVALSATSN